MRVETTTRIIQVDPAGDPSRAVSEAVEVIKRGGLVAFPTETVYGVAARGDRSEAVERLRDVKGRADTQPFTVHIGKRSDAAQFVPEISPLARRMMGKGWPGPLTLVFTNLQVDQTVAFRTLGSQAAELLYHNRSIGLRCPDDRIATAFLSEAGVPIVAASANRGGRPAPTTAVEVMQELGGQVDLLLDGGRARYGRASTIVEISGSGYRLLRTGVYDERTVKRLATLSILLVCTGNTCRSPMAEVLCRQALANRLGCTGSELAERGIEVASAGTAAADLCPASPEAVEVMMKRGLDLSKHRSQRVAMELVNRADHVFTMTRGHRDMLVRMAPEAADRVCTLLAEDDVDDPIGLDVEAYELCASIIAEALKARLSEVQ